MNEVALTENSRLIPVYKEIDKHFATKKAHALKIFARQYFASTSKTELKKLPEQELYRLLIEAWGFIATHKAGTRKIEILAHNPGADSSQQSTMGVFVLMNDMPFIVDSLRQGMNRIGLTIKRVNNAVIFAKRNAATGNLIDLSVVARSGYHAEALCCVRCLPVEHRRYAEIRQEVEETLQHVSAAVADFPEMVRRAIAITERLQTDLSALPVVPEEAAESLEFILWLVENHFIFLGYEAYRIRNSKAGRVVELQDDSLLGVSRFKTGLKKRARFDDLPAGTGELILKKRILSFAKSSVRSRVHRPAYFDYVLIKEFDKQGKVAVEHRFSGLYTSAVYYRAALEIPLVRKKVNRVLTHSGFAPNGHSIKDLLQVINVYPRDELFQISHKQLAATAIEIAQIQETRTTKLFIRRDEYGKFFSCLVYIPRDSFNTSVRLRIQAFLAERLQAVEVDFNTYLSDSILVRMHFILRAPLIHTVKYKLAELEKELSELVKPWEEHFFDALQARYTEQKAMEVYAVYGSCFSQSYKESYTAETAAADIECIGKVIDSEDLALQLSGCTSSAGAELCFKIFSYRQQLFLSDVDPILENLGLNIISEKTFVLQPGTEYPVWLHEFSLYRKFGEGEFSDTLRHYFEDAFRAIWRRRINDDSYNALVVAAGVSWRDAALLRAFAAYLKQIQFGYGLRYMAETLARHQQISHLLIDYFHVLFDPAREKGRAKRARSLRETVVTAIDAVVNLSEDSVLRGFLNVIDGTLRTNYFQPDREGVLKDYFSFKFDPQRIDGVPLPKPKFEIFVFSRQVEGVHLRGGNVARGGLRWSDRTEDYRTEVLGLVKAQQVKNSVIVPVGAKGGFVVKEPVPMSQREQYLAQGVRCYQTFVSGLLDLTDNLQGDVVVPPRDVVRRDTDDPYLVVAADKGTATFSDIANKLAAEYGFWLGDGFASGGSNGYDHKQMGITAKGAWVSVQRHFRELGINVQEQDFTVVGIGDMSGDVFGNGMLLSAHIQLVAAFNHLHIFVDPNPDAARSFNERQRLFKLPRSNWSDYDAALISRGGGVFERTAKSVRMTAEIKARFGITADSLTPNEFIRQLLCSEVDLLWNGGIGTYVKAESESHADVGDKNNDAFRVNGNELRCKVIGEGGNLGMTQLARIEYGKRGGISLTDFIDNSAGVDCSDHEVNIKIVLNKLHVNGKLSSARRNSLLESMTDEVAALALDNNYNQVQAIGIAKAQMELRNREYAELINYLERHAGLNRKLENLPSRDALEERYAKGDYLTRPEIAILTSYMKMFLKIQLVSASYLQDDFLHSYLYSAFPDSLQKRYASELRAHPLRREIIATQLANAVVNLLGPSFVYRMADSTGTSPAEVVKTAIIVKEIFQIQHYWEAIEALDFRIAAEVQIEMMSRLIRLIRRSTRWLLRSQQARLDFFSGIDTYQKKIEATRDMLLGKLPPDYLAMYDEKRVYLRTNKVPEALAQGIVECEFLFPAISFIEISNYTGEKLDRVVDTFYAIGEELQLNWLGKMINQTAVGSYWQALARESYLDDLSRQQQALTCNVVLSNRGRLTPQAQVRDWADRHATAINRALHMLRQLQAESQPDYSMFSVVLREFQALAQATHTQN